MGATVVKAGSIAQLETELQAAKTAKIPTVIVIDTDPMPGTGAGGTWWDVAVPEVSTRAEVNEARKGYEEATKQQWLVN
jgi:3D-(3,5/4)-trihydroxycyclohexane-1,2-dione acylhydrolase (decyclizing)